MKYFFFDVDGTLYSPTNGISESTKKTIKQLIDNGHFVAIATGRSYNGSISVLEEIGISNAVVDGGHCGYVNGKKIFSEPIDKDVVISLVEEATEKNIDVGIIDDGNCYLLNDNLVNKMRVDHPWINIEIVDKLPIDEIVLKKVVLDIDESGVEMFTALKHKINHLYIHTSDFVVTDQDHKLQGINKILNEVGGTVDDLIVFGDSRNDIMMFNGASISICMGDAEDIVKNKASFVTKGVDEDGITYACTHFNWI